MAVRALSLVCWVAVAACGGAASLPRTPIVTVTNAGAGARVLLRYEHVAGTAERVRIAIKLRTRQEYENTVMEQGRRALDFPTLQLTGTLTVTDVAADGSAGLAFTIEDAQVLDDVVDPRMRRALEARTTVLRGTTQRWRRAANGSESHDDVTSELADAMRESGLRFPDVPVGIGATWQVRSAYESNHVRWLSVATFTVRDLTPTTVTIDGAVELRADEQTISAEPNATTVVTSGRGRGSSHAVIALRGVAATGDANRHVELELLVTRKALRVKARTTGESVFAIGPAP